MVLGEENVKIPPETPESVRELIERYQARLREELKQNAGNR